jgi:fumarate hydratase subunit beta
MPTLLDWQSVLDVEVLARLNAGDEVELTGTLITVRDGTVKRLAAILDDGDRMPIDLRGQLLYAVGPSPSQPGQIVGSAGPTTTERMCHFLPTLFKFGARGVIGKGELRGEIVRRFVECGAIYFAAIGGLGAQLAKHVTASEILAFPELGPEAVHRFRVERFPTVVIIDSTGANLHETARGAWRR